MTAVLRKMKMISEAELERLRAKQLRDYDPELTSLARLQRKIDEILDDARHTDAEKLQLLRAFQHRFKSLNEKEEMEQSGMVLDSRPMPVARQPRTTTSSPPPAEYSIRETETEGALSVLEEAVSALPTQYHAKATKMIQSLSRRPDIITFDESTQQLIHNGKIIEGSNAHDLIKHVYFPRKGQVPAGLAEFTKAVKFLNIPTSYFSNQRFILSLTKPKAAREAQSGEGRPPGAGPKVLAVYSKF